MMSMCKHWCLTLHDALCSTNKVGKTIPFLPLSSLSSVPYLSCKVNRKQALATFMYICRMFAFSIFDKFNFNSLLPIERLHFSNIIDFWNANNALISAFREHVRMAFVSAKPACDRHVYSDFEKVVYNLKCYDHNPFYLWIALYKYPIVENEYPNLGVTVFLYNISLIYAPLLLIFFPFGFINAAIVYKVSKAAPGCLYYHVAQAVRIYICFKLLFLSLLQLENCTNNRKKVSCLEYRLKIERHVLSCNEIKIYLYL